LRWCVFMWISEQTANFTLYGFSRLLFITKTEYVYCAVWAESLYKTDTFHFQRVNTGRSKITSTDFKVNNKKTIRDTKILFLDSETTTWEVLNHIVLKRISCK